MIHNITLFCASSNDVKSCFFDESARLGHWIGKNNKRLIYGGANVGLMEETARNARDAGAEVVGVITEHICDLGKASDAPQQLIKVKNMSERKQILMDMADVFIALPGGIGTLDEVFDVLATGHLGYHHKKLIFCNTNGFYTNLLELLESFYSGHFASPSYKDLYWVGNNIEECLLKIDEWDKIAS